MVRLASLVSLSNFVCPLVLILQAALLHVQTRMDSRSGSNVVLLKQISQFHALFMALKHIWWITIVELAETFNYAILARSIDFLESLLHLGLELAALKIRLFNSCIFGLNEESEILAFFLKKTKCASPLDIAAVPFFLYLDDFKVKSVVFLGNTFVFFLKGN